jgi:hypothetical protein
MRETALRRHLLVSWSLNFQAIEMQIGSQKNGEGGLMIKQAAAARAVITGLLEISNHRPIRVKDNSIALPVVLQ